MAEQTGIIYCGSCGALNPRSNHFCSACGHQLVDTYHSSEGLHVYQHADPSAPIVEIIDPGAEIDVVVSEEDIPGDFVKVALEDGRIGYVRLRDVEQAYPEAQSEPVRREPVGCISSTALLAIIILSALGIALTMLVAFRSDDSTADFIAVLSCIGLVPVFLAVIGFYLYTRKREKELLADADGIDSGRRPDDPIEAGD